MYDPKLSCIIEAAFLRICENLDEAGPSIAQCVSTWVSEMCEGRMPEDAYKSPQAYPMLLLPWWVEKTISQTPDVPLQMDLVYSTVNGYYAIRLIDNLMDGQDTTRLQVLPVLHFFYTEFQRPYQRYFEPEHLFWDFFTKTWFDSAELALEDACADTIDRAHFVKVSARKTEAVKIPIAAVCYRHDCPDLLAPWVRFVDVLGCWHQMQDDLFDWREDLELGTQTYFLSEAARRKRPRESVAEWVAREGFDWGIETLGVWTEQSRALGRELDCPDLLAYFDNREALLSEKKGRIMEGFRAVSQLYTLIVEKDQVRGHLLPN